jgi:hypothetical protein
MSVRLLHPEQYEFVDRSSFDSQDTLDVDDADYASYSLNKPKYRRRDRPLFSRLIILPFSAYRQIAKKARQSRRRCGRLTFRRLVTVVELLLGLLLALILATFAFRPSYTYLPPSYQALHDAMLMSKASGRGNPRNEKVFVAVSLYDQGGDLAGGVWGQAVLDLIDLLGEENTYLSIYENDSGVESEKALRELEARVPCNKSIVFEEHFDLSTIPSVDLPDGTRRTKRIPYLAAVRNRALEPLDANPHIRYDKLLFMNDVYFDPMDAVQLLFSTNTGPDGLAHYKAACAADFINAFKFYDSFALRDLHGHGVGVPFFPWFTSAGAAESRLDVRNQRDAVRVRSCWGGMVAFDASYFQSPPSAAAPPTIHGSRSGLASKRLPERLEARRTPKTGPIRFRAGSDFYWESSECCLIHADIQDNFTDVETITDTGIYLNPYIRVAYDVKSFSWLGFTRRFERLYSFPHWVANIVAGMPDENPRRTEVAGSEVQERVWQPDATRVNGGSWGTVKRIADNGGFCARPDLHVLIMNREKGQDGWESLAVDTDPYAPDK